MRVSNEEISKALLYGKIKRFDQKIQEGDITFDDCGLDRKKNFLQPSKLVLIDGDAYLEEYCINLCAECPYSKCAVFLIHNDHHVSCVVKFDFNEFDTFDLDDSWYCWNLISFEENFDLSAYGILCEICPGEWKTIIN